MLINYAWMWNLRTDRLKVKFQDVQILKTCLHAKKGMSDVDDGVVSKSRNRSDRVRLNVSYVHH